MLDYDYFTLELPLTVFCEEPQSQFPFYFPVTMLPNTSRKVFLMLTKYKY